MGSRGRGKVDVEALERDNDQGLSALAEKVALLKGATHGIKNEVDSQHSMLDRMDDGMTGTRGVIGSINDKFKTVMSNPQQRQLTLIVSAAVGVLLLFYLFTRKG